MAGGAHVDVEQLLLERETMALLLQVPACDLREGFAHPLGTLVALAVVHGARVVVEAPRSAHVGGKQRLVRVARGLEALAPLVEVRWRRPAEILRGLETLGAGDRKGRMDPVAREGEWHSTRAATRIVSHIDRSAWPG